MKIREISLRQWIIGFFLTLLLALLGSSMVVNHLPVEWQKLDVSNEFSAEFPCKAVLKDVNNYGDYAYTCENNNSAYLLSHIPFPAEAIYTDEDYSRLGSVFLEEALTVNTLISSDEEKSEGVFILNYTMKQTGGDDYYFKGRLVFSGNIAYNLFVVYDLVDFDGSFYSRFFDSFEKY